MAPRRGLAPDLVIVSTSCTGCLTARSEQGSILLVSESEPTPSESPTEPTEPTPPELHEVLFVVCQNSGQPKVYKGKAYILPENIYIDTIDAKGLAWLRAWQDSGFFTAYEVEIKTKFSREHPRRTLFEGFVSIGYLNPRDTPDREQKSIERFAAFLRVNQPFGGTPLVRNWREFKGQDQAWYCEEWIIYSDACFSGSFKLGPYKVINMVAREDFINGSLVLRACVHSSMLHGLQTLCATGS